MRIFDTQVAIHLLAENRLHKGLKDLAKDILHVPATEIKSYTEVDSENLLEFGDYAINDACWTYRLYQQFAPQIEKENLGHLFYNIELPFQFALVELAINGISADVPLSEQMTADVRHLFYETEKQLLNMFGKTWELKCTKRTKEITCEPQINFNSSQQVVGCMNKLGIQLTDKTDKGQLSTSHKTLLNIKQQLESKLNDLCKI